MLPSSSASATAGEISSISAMIYLIASARLSLQCQTMAPNKA